MQTESFGAAGKVGVSLVINSFPLPPMDSNTSTLSANWMRTKVYDEPESLPMIGLGAFSFSVSPCVLNFTDR